MTSGRRDSLHLSAWPTCGSSSCRGSHLQRICHWGGKPLPVACVFFCTREIELSLALRCHLSVNPVAKPVSWNLPCSKTDPQALGKTRTWDCVCDGSLDKPCAFHALARHCTYLDQKFSGMPQDALPLFPDLAGNTVEKVMVVKLIEAAASQGCR